MQIGQVYAPKEIRSANRREMKKVMENMKSGGGTDDLYVPSSWYFDEIDFLRNKETQIQGTSTWDKTEFIKGNKETKVQFFMHTNTNTIMAAQQLSVSDMFNEQHHKTV